MLTLKEICRGSWDGDNWVHISCPLVNTIGIPHAPHEVDPEEYDPSDEEDEYDPDEYDLSDE